MFKQWMVKTMGVVFFLAALYFAFQGAAIFVRQMGQRSWVPAEAEVIWVDSRWESRGVRRSRSTLVYDVDYRYTVGGVSYTGGVTGTVMAWQVGDSLEIKYDPAAPERSTDILTPQANALVVNLGFACFLGAVGLAAAGVLPLEKRRRSL